MSILLNIDEEVQKALDAIRDQSSPIKMSPGQALEFLQYLYERLELEIEALVVDEYKRQ